MIGNTGAGPRDPDPDSWEIDEPNFLQGDILQGLQRGQLENTNQVPFRRPSRGADVEILLSEDEEFIGSLVLKRYDRDPDSETVITLSGQASLGYLPPTAVCRNVEIVLDETGQETITPAAVDGGSSDPEGEPLLLAVDQTLFTCSDLGSNVVILTVSDSGGQTDQCQAVVTVLDLTPPLLSPPSNRVVECDASTNPASTGLATANDNCDVDPEIRL